MTVKRTQMLLRPYKDNEDLEAVVDENDIVHVRKRSSGQPLLMMRRTTWEQIEAHRSKWP